MDVQSDNSAIDELSRLGIAVIKSLRMANLSKCVCSHPDMQIAHLGKNRFICDSYAYNYYKDKLNGADLKVSKTALKPMYPYDVLYNCVKLGKYLICNTACTASEILSEYQTYETIHVKQGYTKCNIAIISKEAIITSDTGIYNALKNKLDVLKIEQGYIELPGVDYGFIGGASGLIDKDVLALNGSLDTHPNADEIKGFCKNHRVDIYELRKGVIKDIGSILPIF